MQTQSLEDLYQEVNLIYGQMKMMEYYIKKLEGRVEYLENLHSDGITLVDGRMDEQDNV